MRMERVAWDRRHRVACSIAVRNARCHYCTAPALYGKPSHHDRADRAFASTSFYFRVCSATPQNRVARRAPLRVTLAASSMDQTGTLRVAASRDIARVLGRIGRVGLANRSAINRNIAFAQTRRRTRHRARVLPRLTAHWRILRINERLSRIGFLAYRAHASCLLSVYCYPINAIHICFFCAFYTVDIWFVSPVDRVPGFCVAYVTTSSLAVAALL
jgi:hypothetical protein